MAIYKYYCKLLLPVNTYWVEAYAWRRTTYNHRVYQKEMSAEFYIRFQDADWLRQHNNMVKNQLLLLAEMKSENEFWFINAQESRYAFDVRLFFEAGHILLEITVHPAETERNLSDWLNWLRSCTEITILDEDGASSGW